MVVVVVDVIEEIRINVGVLRVVMVVVESRESMKAGRQIRYGQSYIQMY